MNRLPRILPLVGVAVGGVLAINALAGARDLPALVSGARAWAEDVVKPAKTAAKSGAKAKSDVKAKSKSEAETSPPDPDAIAPPGTSPTATPAASAPTGQATDAAATVPASAAPATKAICAPTAAELAKEAGLSPAELQVLQNLGARRGQLDQREQDLSTQMALLSAAEAKVDAKLKALSGLKGDITNLLAQADGREAGEVARLVKVFEGMKPKDAAARMAILDDSVRLPIAAKMKERALSGIVSQMPPADAKKLTEALAKRFTAAQTLAQTEPKVEAAAGAAPPADPGAKPAKAKARPTKQAKSAPRKRAPTDQQAAAQPAAPAKDPAAAAPVAAPAKSG